VDITQRVINVTYTVTREEWMQFSATMRRVNSQVIDRVSAVIEIEGYLVPVASSYSPLIRICLSDTQLNAHPMTAL
jgi:hypothetical protein